MRKREFNHREREREDGRDCHLCDRQPRAPEAAADRVVAVSDEDVDLIRARFGVDHTAVVENGVDNDYFRPGKGPREPDRILFLGGLDWRPNLDAIDQLLDTIFPAVRAVVPSAKLCLVGRRPPASLRRRVGGLASVELHADVPDVRPFLACSGVMAVPLRVGGGSRLKILGALAAGVPVISTRVGPEGLNLEPGRHLTVVDGIAPMADALLQAVGAPSAALAQAEAGRRRVLEFYDWNALAVKLENVWIDCVDHPRPARAAKSALTKTGASL